MEKPSDFEALWDEVVEDSVEEARRRIHLTPGMLAAQGFSPKQIDQRLLDFYGPTKQPS